MSSPRVSIVTTVYDRVDCLERCLRMMARSHYQDFEQIVVSDCPPAQTVREIEAVVTQARTRVQVTHHTLPERRNDWGMTPAYVGLRLALGEFVCFLSDDNAYLPDHLGPLVTLLDQHPGVGFVYSSCHYAGRTVLRDKVPRGARIDLGQPLFRTKLLLDTFPQGFPFNEFAWDWRLIAALMERGVTWKHRDVLSFVFRLAAYPQFMAEAS